MVPEPPPCYLHGCHPGPAALQRGGAFYFALASLKAIMVGDSAKEIMLWIGGLLVAGAITILGAIWAVDSYLAFHDPNDPLTEQGGLAPAQDTKRGE